MRAGAVSDWDASLLPVGEVWSTVLRHESALDSAMGRKMKMPLSVRKEFPTRNLLVTASDKDDDTWMADISKVLGIDIPSGDTGRAQV